MTNKNEALKLAQVLEDDTNEHMPVSRSEIAAMLRTQAVEIERLTSGNVALPKPAGALRSDEFEGYVFDPAKDWPFGDLYTKVNLTDYANRRAASAISERDKLKAKNNKLVEALSASTAILHTFSDKHGCTCSQCQFVMLRDIALKEVS